MDSEFTPTDPPNPRDAHSPSPRPTPFAVLRHFRHGERLVCAGAPAAAVYLIYAGQVRVYLERRRRSGRVQEVTTALLDAGHLVGISAFLGRPTHQAAAEALTPVDAWELTGDRLRRQLPHQPALQEVVLRAIGRELAQSEALLRAVVLHPVAQRLSDVPVLFQPAPGGEAPRLNREHLARLVGARRETVSRAAVAGTSRRPHRGAPPRRPLRPALTTPTAA